MSSITGRPADRPASIKAVASGFGSSGGATWIGPPVPRRRLAGPRQSSIFLKSGRTSAQLQPAHPLWAQSVEVARVPAHPRARIVAVTAAEHLAARNVIDAVETTAERGRVPTPVERPVKQRRPPRRIFDVGMIVRAARLEQQHRAGRILAQTGGHRAPGGPGSHHDVIVRRPEFLHEWQGGNQTGKPARWHSAEKRGSLTSASDQCSTLSRITSLIRRLSACSR